MEQEFSEKISKSGRPELSPRAIVEMEGVSVIANENKWHWE